MPVNDQARNRLSKLVDADRGSFFNRLAHRPVPILASIAWRLTAQCTGRFITRRARLFWGQPITVVFPERFLSRQLYRYGYWEEGLTRICMSVLKPGMVFFDVGAHMGYFSLLASELVGAEGQVHSFEPTPRTFGWLKRNVEGKANITANQLAVYSESTQIQFRDFGPGRSGFNSHYAGRMPDEDRIESTTRIIHVNTTTLDEYAQRAGIRPDFIKLDAEGAEIDILDGMKEILDHVHPMISLEVGDVGESVKSRQWIDRLTEAGYPPYEYADGRIQKHQPQDAYTHDNLLFVHGSRAAGLPR